MLFRHTLAASLFAATALAAATPASAQRVGRIVAFGDSYADDGNLFQLIGQPFPLAYPTGRFSGGTNYIDTLGQLLGTPIDNFAIGGALATNNNTIAGPGVLGFPTEVASFLGGGGPAAFPRVSGMFGPTDLLAVSVLGNDGRVYQQAGGTVVGASAVAAGAVTSATTGLDALVAVGARNISFLAGNTASVPEVASDPAAQAVRNAYSTAFNNGIKTTLAGYANQGVIVNYTDLSLIGARITANPSAYGLVSAGACPITCVSTTPALQNDYLFYVDQLHLTSAGFIIVAKYVRRQMQAPLNLQATSDVGIDTARQFGRTLSTHMDLGSPRDGDTLTGVRLFAIGDSVSRKIGASQTNDAFKVTSVGGTLGLEAAFGGGTVGIAGNYSRPRAKFGNASASVRSHSYQVGAFAGIGLAGGFAQGYLGYGKDKHRVTRAGVIDDLAARPGGSHWLAGAKAGYLFPFASVRLGPLVGVDYARAKVDAYSETGDSALALNVSGQRLSTLRGDAGIELRGDFAGGGVQVRPYVSVLAEHEFNRGARGVTYALQAAPTIVNRFAFADASKKTYARASGGLHAEIVKAVSIDAGISATFGKKQGDETSGQVGLNFGF